MSRLLTSFDPSSYRQFFLRGITNFYQHGISTNKQSKHSFGSSATVEIEKETSSASYLSSAVHQRLHGENPPFSFKKEKENVLSRNATLTSDQMLSEKYRPFVYSPAKSCHISKEHILEVIEMLDETSTVENFCERYDKMRSMKFELDGLIPTSLMKIDRSELCTSLSTYVRDIDNHFGLLAKGQGSCNNGNQNRYEDLVKLELLLTSMFDEMKEFYFRYSIRDYTTSVRNTRDTQPGNWEYDSYDGDNAADLLFTSSYGHAPSFRVNSCSVAHNSVLKSDPYEFWTTIKAADPDKSDDSQDNRANRYQLEKVQNYFIDRLPIIFEEPFDYSVFTDDVILINEWVDRPYTKRGLSSCQFELWKLKMWINIKFKTASVHVLNCVINENTSSVKIRWRITGQSKLDLFKRTSKTSGDPQTRKDLEDEWHDGVSTLYVNSSGLVYKHVIDKMDKEPLTPKIKNTLKGKVAALLGLAGAGAMDEM